MVSLRTAQKARQGQLLGVSQGPCWANVLLLRLEIVNAFWTGSPAFLFCTGPADYAVNPAAELNTCLRENGKGRWGLCWKQCLKWLFKSKQPRTARMWPHGLPPVLRWGQLWEGQGLARPCCELYLWGRRLATAARPEWLKNLAAKI